MEDWERKHNEGWIDRWYRLTGNKPVGFQNNIAINRCDNKSHKLVDDALTKESQKFKKRMRNV